MAAEGLVGDDTGDLLESLKGAAHSVEGGVHKMEATIKKGAHALEEGVKKGVGAVEGAVKRGAQAVEEGVETLATKVCDPISGRRLTAFLTGTCLELGSAKP